MNNPKELVNVRIIKEADVDKCSGSLAAVTVSPNGSVVVGWREGGEDQSLTLPPGNTLLDITSGTKLTATPHGSTGYKPKETPQEFVSTGGGEYSMFFGFEKSGDPVSDADFGKAPAGSAHNEIMSALKEIDRKIGVIMKNTCLDGACV